MKKLRNFFREKKGEFNRRYNAALSKDEKIYEVELWGRGEEGFNNDEQHAWEIIKEIYQEVLFDDENWHFFYENYYNIIRCSVSFYPRLIQKLKDLGVYYKEKGEWTDEQGATKKYQKVFQGMFHYFTLMALEEYDSDEIAGIYDRVSHCFFNHQFYVLENIRKKYGSQWEAHIMSYAMVNRADYSSYLKCNGADPSTSTYINISEKSLVDQVKEREERIKNGRK